ncbi:DUF192 domain-containing protein [Acidimangrovimonas pyrenivorans]|uniref:DUF192 domain-containing protein n=1 Tax=Acidimangrovimonas pyrenivorans TaxID=2030798 RepID=A0ABV7AF91_9RHOB
MRAWLAALLVLVPLAARAECRPDRVELRGSKGVVRFEVELATTEAARQRGLMNRAHLPSGAGMLFLYPRPSAVNFWMKDTLIPLDILFADRRGRVTRLKAMARPGDERLIPGGDKVQAVLEINGGLAAQLGIGPGTVMRHPGFDPAVVAWPCGGR